MFTSTGAPFSAITQVAYTLSHEETAVVCAPQLAWGRVTQTSMDPEGTSVPSEGMSPVGL